MKGPDDSLKKFLPDEPLILEFRELLSSTIPKYVEGRDREKAIFYLEQVISDLDGIYRNSLRWESIDTRAEFERLVEAHALLGNPDLGMESSKDLEIRFERIASSLIGELRDFIDLISEEEQEDEYAKGIYEQKETSFIEQSEEENNPESSEFEGKKSTSSPSEPASDPFLDTRLHADHWAREDLLGYERYAYNIQQIIKRKKARPPLTIGVIAPWGQGKTTLMRYIERSFEGATSKEKFAQEEAQSHVQATKKEIERWSQDDSYQKDKFPSYPCVWFNPWQYQSSEQIYAGMAHAIIHQLVAKLSAIKQEEFWFKLQSRRIDKQAMRRDAVRDAITETIPAILITLVMAVVPFLLKSIFPQNAGPFLAGIGLPLISILAAIRKWLTSYAESFKEKYEEYLRSPEYEKKLGYFHEVNEDLQRVFDLLVEEETPALIFIDDLDRCSPQKVVEVIEAINLMMNANFRKKCYFILGMDAEMVAASIDVAYAKMQGSIPGKVNKFGSIGWYFLDKFIQLPFLIPTLSEEKKQFLVSKLFEESQEDNKEEKEEDALPSPGKVRRIRIKRGGIEGARVVELKEKARQIKKEPRGRSLQESEPTPKIQIKTQEERTVFEQEFLDLGFESTEEESEIQQKVGKFATYLHPSPRSIKRFANLLRFHTSIQKLRQATNEYLDIEGDNQSYEEFADMDTLAFWLLLTLRWPLLVRWLQWENEEKLDTDTAVEDNLLFASQRTGEKARILDMIIRESRKRALELELKSQAFERMYGEWLELSKANSHLNWLRDKELIQLFFDQFSEKNRLERAFLCGVW